MRFSASRKIPRRAAICLTSVALLALMPPYQSSLAASNKANERLVHEATNRFLDAIRNGAQRQDFETILNNYTSMQTIALFALGKHRRKLEPSRHKLYLAKFNEMILNELAKHGKKLGGKAFVVTRSFDDIVQGYVQHNLDRTTKIELRVKNNRITDIRVQGFWLALTLRQSFDQLINNNGGKLDAVFDFLSKSDGSS